MKRILVVDDDPQLRQAVLSLLIRTGLPAEACANGVEALAAHQREPADLALIDLFMPEMDGLETLQALRRHAPRLPIVVISGGGTYVDHHLLLTAKRLGAHHVLAKPFTLEELLHALSAASEAAGQPLALPKARTFAESASVSALPLHSTPPSA